MTSRMLAALACALRCSPPAAAAATTRSPSADAGADGRRDRRRPRPRAKKVDRFDGDRAWKMLEYQVKLGPRPAGSRAVASKLAAYIKARLPNARYEELPGGLRNVVGEIPGKGKPIVLAAHYDTKDIPDFVGANDGAGGTAQMLEIARVLQKTKRSKNAPPIWFVAFDGEEATDDSDFYGTGLRGSKPFAKKYAKRIKELVLLDFVADKDLAIPREQSSDAEMWADLREAAERVGSDSAFPDARAGRRRGRPHAVRPPRRPVDRPDRLRLPLLAPDLRRPHRRVQGVLGQERRGRARVPQEPLRALRIAAPSARRRRRSSPSRRPRCAAPGGRARRCRRPSTCRRPGSARRRSARAATSTWLSTTSLRISAPPSASSRGEAARACAQ